MDVPHYFSVVPFGAVSHNDIDYYVVRNEICEIIVVKGKDCLTRQKHGNNKKNEDDIEEHTESYAAISGI